MTFAGFKPSMKEVTADVEIAEEPKLVWSLKILLNCSNLMIKLKQKKSCFL